MSRKVVFDIESGEVSTKNECDCCKEYFETHIVPENIVKKNGADKTLTDIIEEIYGDEELEKYDIDLCKKCLYQLFEKINKNYERK